MNLDTHYSQNIKLTEKFNCEFYISNIYEITARPRRYRPIERRSYEIKLPIPNYKLVYIEQLDYTVNRVNQYNYELYDAESWQWKDIFLLYISNNDVFSFINNYLMKHHTIYNINHNEYTENLFVGYEIINLAALQCTKLFGINKNVKYMLSETELYGDMFNAITPEFNMEGHCRFNFKGSVV